MTLNIYFKRVVLISHYKLLKLNKRLLKTPKMSSNFSIDIGGMRAEYRNKNNVFTEDQLVAKEPFLQFKAWFDEACKTPEILEPNAMCLATSTRYIFFFDF